MSRKNVLKTYKIWDSADLSGNLTSGNTSVINLDNASIYVSWSGTAPSGEIVVQGTNDDPDKNASPTWKDLDFGSTITVSGASGNHDLILNSLPFNSLRLKYNRTSGSGSIIATITAKTQGA